MSKQFLKAFSWVLLLGWPAGQATAQARLVLRQWPREQVLGDRVAGRHPDIAVFGAPDGHNECERYEEFTAAEAITIGKLPDAAAPPPLLGLDADPAAFISAPISGVSSCRRNSFIAPIT